LAYSIKYRVSHGKVNKIILLWWEYRFSFLPVYILDPMCSWDKAIYGYFISLYWIDVSRHLWFNMSKLQKKMEKRVRMYVLNVKLFSISFFSLFFGFFDAFLFRPSIKGKCLSICWLFTCCFLNVAKFFWNNSKFTKEQDIYVCKLNPKLCNQVPSLSLFRWRTLILLKI
jgi:glucan phosphoethanolaminetransferase (alkaline phosphatase superfamily)